MHTFLIIPTDKIPHHCDTSCCRHSNDNQFIIVDGYHNGILVAPAWVDDSILIYANEYTKEQFDALSSDTGSIWYTEPEELI